jgi:hypothetical protein
MKKDEKREAKSSVRRLRKEGFSGAESGTPSLFIC